MSKAIAKPSGSGASSPPTVGGRTQDELRQLFRRGQSPRTASMYVGSIVRAETFCSGDGISLDELGAEDLARR